MSLDFILTNAGKSLIATAGTIGPVNLSYIKVGSSGYTPAPTATGLVTPIKSITPSFTLAGPGIIHLTAQDSSSDAYNVREVGIFTDGDVLFAISARALDIANKLVDSVMLLSIDLTITDLPPGSVTLGDSTFDYPPATETTIGVAEIATQSEVDTGTDDTRIVTPKKLFNSGFVKKAGATMTGLLTLSGNPTTGLHSATKAYVDAADALKVAKAGDTMTGALTLHADPASALQAATKQYADLKVAKSGDTMTGLLTLSGNPSLALHAATKAYADGTLSAAASGYQILPSGLIIQWGVGRTAGGTAAITFPIAFPSACYATFPAWKLSGVSNTYSVFTSGAPTTTGFNVAASSGYAADFFWFAIGK